MKQEVESSSQLKPMQVARRSNFWKLEPLLIAGSSSVLISESTTIELVLSGRELRFQPSIPVDGTSLPIRRFALSCENPRLCLVGEPTGMERFHPSFGSRAREPSRSSKRIFAQYPERARSEKKTGPVHPDPTPSLPVLRPTRARSRRRT